jgi:hypothetical protein
MRARLHVVQGETDDETVHIPPTAFFDDDTPPYPTPDETADALRGADDLSYSVARHRAYHERQLDDWRETLLDYVVDSVPLPAHDDEVDVSVLGP